ncbi:MAG: carbohydrate binding family 9 domain-containing protein [Acidobacteria bacterium]|nr:carbohydrate binding family 9 domain-containing protein [Acidobacteriota bacterium]
MASCLQLWIRVFVCLSFLLFPLLAHSIDKDGNDALALDARSVLVPRLPSGPRISDFEDMKPHGIALKMAVVSNFIQAEPSDGQHATQRTEVYLGYDAKSLYVVWLCFDNEPKKVRAHLVRRENIYDDDVVAVNIDTFRDHRHGLNFGSNPLGVQADGLWTEGNNNNPDNSWDTVWNTEGRLTSKGFMIWQQIPFRSLRAHGSGMQDWGVTFHRVIARTQESDYWPHVSARIAGRLTQEGLMRGIDPQGEGGNFQLNPYAALAGFRTLDQRDPLDPRLSQRVAQGKIGLDSKMVFRESLVLDATLNPDFAQVESDQPQNTVNQRFEVFFPEKRPFFLENANYFNIQGIPPFGGTSTTLLFTRRIADPSYGLRLTGKQGPWNLGFLFADDKSPGKIVPETDPLFGKKAYFGIARVTHDLGRNSSIGFIYTDRELNGSFNRVGGIDGNYKMGKNWNASFHSVLSSTLDLSNVNSFGQDHEAELDGNGRRFAYLLQYQDITPQFQTEAGFVRRTDIRHLGNYYHFYFRPEGKHLIFHGPELSGERTWDHQGTGIQYNFNGDWVFQYRNNSFFAPVVGIESDTLRPQDFSGLSSDRKFTQDFVGLIASAAPVRQLTLNTQIFRQGAVDIVVPKGQLPVEGDDLSISQTLTLHPFSPLTIDNTYILDRLLHNKQHASVYNNHIIRTKWNYQFTKEFSLRFIAQYNGLLANPTCTSLDTVKNLNFDVLFTYLVHPGTAVYVGYNSNLENVDPGLCLHVAGTLQCDPNGNGLLRNNARLINDGRLVFVKVSYLFRH